MLSNSQLATERRFSASAGLLGPVHQETLDILRDEVAQLQRELADRDARISDLNQLVDTIGPQDRTADEPTPDTLALVTRLEELLDELEHKDKREASLEGQLRAAEEAGRAEQEERRQIEAWLSEIEERVGQREAEWKAASESLHQRLDEVTAERDRAEQTLADVAAGRGTAALPNELPAELRQQIAKLQQKLSDKEQECAALKGRLSGLEAEPGVESQKNELDRLLREERLQIERERVELSRRRAELEHERRLPTRAPNDVDQRVQVLREHLKEAHERELQQQQKERQEHSLTARISRLWKRLDGSA